MPAKFSEPIPGDNPCGVDLRSGVELFNLRDMAKGKPETQFSEARDPDWRDLRKNCETLLARSKDLEVFSLYLLSRLQLDGLDGFADAFEALAESAISFWPQIYPLLDEGDPTERLNILSGLAMPLGSFEDPLRIIERIRSKPIIRSARAGTLNIDEIEARLTRSDIDKSVIEAELRGFFGDADPAFAEATKGCLQKISGLIQKLELFLDETVGVSVASSWTPLKDTLKSQIATYTRYSGATGEPVTAEATMETSTTVTSSSTTPAKTAVPVGSIGSRDDVVRVLESICAYYTANEPSSPVPVLLKRAQGMVRKNFSELIAELAPGATPQINLLEQETSSN